MRYTIMMALLIAAFSLKASSISENSLLVISDPDKTSFWRTATNNVISLPVYFPKGATSATLEVRGDRFWRHYDNLQHGNFELTLPKPARPEDENVYELTLSFDEGTIRNAKLAVITGVGEKSIGSTRCVFDTDCAHWNTFNRRAVLPIPEGMSSFSVNGKSVDLGVGGARSWHMLTANRKESALELSLMTADSEYVASLLGYVPGLMLFFR